MTSETNNKESNNYDKESDKESDKEVEKNDKENPTDSVNGENDGINDTINTGNGTINGTINDTIKPNNDTITKLSEIHQRIVEVIRINPEITRREMVELLNVSDRTISRAVKELQNPDVITREGARKKGKWIILK